MKTLLRNTAVYAFALFLLPSILPGVKIMGGLPTLFFGGFVLMLMLFIVKPVLNLISFPMNMVTLGIFSIFTNIFILYLLTVFVPDVSIHSFTFHGASFAGFTVPEFSLNTFLAFIASAITLSIITSSVGWLTK